MNLGYITRLTLRKIMSVIARNTLYHKHEKLRSVGFDVISEHQKLLACTNADGESYVVRAGDEWIGRGLFLRGEFDFDKFMAAIDILTKVRPDLKPDVLIDVGANVGSICIPAITRGYVDRAIAIEPDPQNSRLLRANIALNGIENKIIAKEAAAGAKDDELLQLVLSGDNFGDHRIRSSIPINGAGGTEENLIKVSSFTIDTLCYSEKDSNVLIWMDIQGYEGFALSGARYFMSRKVPMVLEFCPEMIERALSLPSLLDALKYYSGFIDIDNPGTLRSIEDITVLYKDLFNGKMTDIIII